MKWVLFAMILSPFGQPVDLVDPTKAWNQFETPAACSERLDKIRKEAIETGSPRYLVCDVVLVEEIDKAYRYYKQDFKDRMVP